MYKVYTYNNCYFGIIITFTAHDQNVQAIYNNIAGHSVLEHNSLGNELYHNFVTVRGKINLIPQTLILQYRAKLACNRYLVDFEFIP